MLTMLSRLAAGLGVPEAYARLVVIIAAITLTIAALTVTKCSYDRSIIAAHDPQRDAHLAEGARPAYPNPAVARQADDARLSTETVSLNEVIAHAAPPEPVPLSDARRRYYDCIGLQQAARAAGRPAPACD